MHIVVHNLYYPALCVENQGWSWITSFKHWWFVFGRVLESLCRWSLIFLLLVHNLQQLMSIWLFLLSKVCQHVNMSRDKTMFWSDIAFALVPKRRIVWPFLYKWLQSLFSQISDSKRWIMKWVPIYQTISWVPKW